MKRHAMRLLLAGALLCAAGCSGMKISGTAHYDDPRYGAVSVTVEK